MIKIDTRVTEDLDEKIKKYGALKKINKSEAIRQLIEAGVDITGQESEILKEIKNLNTVIRDNHNYNKKGFDRLASLSVKNGKKIFALWHAVLIQVFLRTLDKTGDDKQAKQSRDEVDKTSTNFGVREFNNRD